MSQQGTVVVKHVVAANEAYRSGDWAAAIHGYLGAVEAGADTADLWLNVGNAYYRAGNKGMAALSWERALRRDPKDEGAKKNLELVRAQVSYAGVVSRPPPVATRIAAGIDQDLAASILMLGWALGCAALIAWLRLGGRGWRRGIAGGLAACCLMVALVGGAATWAAADLRGAGWAVVVEAGEALESPQQGAEAAFPVPETLLLRVVAEEGTWIQVEVPGGLSGWLQREKVAAIDSMERR